MRPWHVVHPRPLVTTEAGAQDRTFLDSVRRAAAATPAKVALRFLADGEQETDHLDYAALDRRARAAAVSLAARCAPGDRVLLLCRPGLEFAVAFLATLYAGCTAVPVAPPGLTLATVASLTAIADDADPALIVRHEVETQEVLTDSVPVVEYGDLLHADPEAWTAPDLRPDGLAFLQYTSGSTGTPRGVMVSHANLLANQAQIGRVFGGGADDVIVSWLPVHHDMGLVGGLLHALYLGASAVLMPPTAFLRRPLRWLRAISAHRGTISPAPDFAYALCADAAADEAASGDLDLSSWRIACNGSEPVRADTLRHFTAAFAPSGFSAGAFCPSYGMAEATLLISGDGRDTAPRTVVFGPGHEVVSCGPWQTDSLLVIDGDTPVPDGEEGEICVAGDNVAAGYWRAPRATEDHFGLCVDGRRYLRTGDLGRIRDGQLYVTGRAKDLLVVRGLNHHPADIETTIQAVDPRLVRAAGAVFDTPRGPVAVQAVRRAGEELADLERSVRAAVAAVHGLVLADCVFVRASAVPRTTSGKVRRGACRAAYLDGTLPRLAAAPAPRATAPRPPHAHALARAVADVLAVPEGALPGDETLTALGLDSLRAIRLQQRLYDEFALDVPLARMLAGTTVDDLVTALGEADGARNTEPQAAADSGARVVGPTGSADAGAASVVPTAPPDPGARSPLPPGGMTQGQQALAFLTAASADGPRDYTIARTFTLPADADSEAVAAALRICVTRHEQLRSRFPRDGEGFRHEVLPSDAHPWCALRTLPDPETLRAHAAELLDAPLDPATGPLFDAVVLKCAGEPAVLVLRVSHLVADLHSLAVLAREWAVAHDAVRRGERPDLPAPTPWEPVVRREAALLADPQVHDGARAWAGRLAAVEPPEWPVVPGDTAARSGGEAVSLHLDDRTTARVVSLAARHTTTPFAVLLGCLGLFVAELTGWRDLAIGVPLAVRDGAETHDAVGYLVNTLPLPLTLPRTTTPGEAISVAARALLDGMDHARIPLSLITRYLQRPRGTSGPPFSVMCDWVGDPGPGTHGFGSAALDLPHDGVTVGGLRLGPRPPGRPRPHADLDVAFTWQGRRLIGRFAFDPAAIDPGTGRTLARCFADFVRRAVTEPAAPAGLTGPATPAAVLLPTTPPVPPVTLGALFREQAALRPDAPALVAPDRRWSYADLAARVSETAAALPDLPEAKNLGTPLVGLHLDDTVEFTVAALAALVRGYGIVPLPTDLPAPRLAFMAGDCGVAAVVHPPPRATAVAEWAGDAVAVALPPLDPDRSPDRPAPPLSVGRDTPDGIAYVVYTSGTTGRPKGVPVRHREVHPLLAWQVGGLGAGPGMRLAQTLALTFDFGLQELFTTLLWGGTLCVPAPAERHSAAGYGEFLRRDDVNTLFATPTFLRELVAEHTGLKGIRLLVLGGETLSPAAVSAALPLLAPDCRIINGYGPTEASINCTMHTVDTGRLATATTLPVGMATGASRVYVMGPGGAPLPEGVVGEVCIGGPGVTRGYLNRPEETERGFVPDQVVADGTAMYRTGDLGLVRAGELHLVGRRDAQVKVRGYRVEPGEVEAALRALPDVADAAVVVDRSGAAARLMAFVVADTAATEDTLRRELAAFLPAFLLPQRIVRVDAFPLTRHGKLDETALLARVPRPSPIAGRPLAGDLTAVVADVWREVLGLDSLDVDTNFFEAGGYSLAVGPVLDRISRRLGTGELPFRLLFEHPTVRLLAQHLQRLLAETAAAGPPTGTPPPARPLAVARRARGRQRALSHREHPDPRSTQ
ncbi:amino acid adenylation domain-containing protein [Streptomyces sp. NPDC049687]|uniref:amino acid adenylation domain-containing protein n=1 Tax=Streptomyces sp. NPDC049687 TaxID=3365596 RepID=UPI0037977CC3